VYPVYAPVRIACRAARGSDVSHGTTLISVGNSDIFATKNHRTDRRVDPESRRMVPNTGRGRARYLVYQIIRLKCLASRCFHQQRVRHRRYFASRRHLASFIGLAPNLCASGDVRRNRGISKAGTKLARQKLVELAWFWLRYRWRFGLHGCPSRVTTRSVVGLWRLRLSSPAERSR
jgi:hypothetical protein